MGRRRRGLRRAGAGWPRKEKTMTESADVFISYSRDDKDKVLELAAQLRSAGVGIWIDQGGIDGAAMWGEAIVNAIEHAKVMVLMVSESSVRSHNVAKEVVLTSARKGHILPILLEPTTIPPSLKYPLAGIQQIEFFQGPPDESLKAILRSLEKLGVNVAPSPGVAGAADEAASGKGAG